MSTVLNNLQIYSKSIAALVLALLIWINQRWGFALPADPDTVSLITGLIIAAGVAVAPKNKLTLTQTAHAAIEAKGNPVVAAKVAEVVAEQKAEAKAEAVADKATADAEKKAKK
jgi:hypothetical protein